MNRIGILPADHVIRHTEDLAMFLGHSRDGFHADLLSLIARADAGNRTRLYRAFPREVFAYLTWMDHGGDEPPTASQLREVMHEEPRDLS